MELSETYSPFRAFKPHFNTLARVGFYKLFLGTPSKLKLRLHGYYRVFIWLFVTSYSLQHLITLVQNRHSTDRMLDTLCILLTTLSMLGKYAAFNARERRMDCLIRVINGSKFAPKSPEQIKLMRSNEEKMAKVLYLFIIMTTFGCILMAIYPMFNKAMGRELFLNVYLPFDTSQSPVFQIVVLYLSFNLSIQACGNVTMDCIIAASYAMVKVQLRMLRYNLEHLLDREPADAGDEDNSNQKQSRFMDNQLIQGRLEHCVQHHLQILWFFQEVESILCEAMFFQLLVMSWVLCTTVNKIVGLSVATPEFWTMLIYLCCVMSQLFLYSSFGTQVKVESEFVAQSIYCCDWTVLSPAFRRQLLLMMQCAARPMEPCVAKVVPISLQTAISVVKASYTLLTVLDKK